MFVFSQKIHSAFIKEFDFANGTRGLKAIETKNGDFVILGFEWTGRRNLLLRVNSSGDLLWAKGTNVGYADGPAQMLELNDGTFLILGRLFLDESAAHPSGYLLKMSSFGEVLYTKIFPFEQISEIRDALILVDGSIVVVGSTELPRAVVAKLSITGDVIWSRTFDAKVATSLSVTTNGSFLVDGLKVIDLYSSYR